ncbi:branched-chain amino acid transaminase [Corallococcus llansteffanensis]|uniref:Branched-chain-amino-acid aminotransferase n=1 Tax=Corallococcus llansteffanensis TaxID=2316731 RepID=A0A3A8PIQ6_9BACT|nr:branched-chain amino acid transaminase [Corallococcus llansteffanensis]RKH56236.1 branched-chain amino acid transaminase [Corallococcus llansteffanensis]
MRKWTFQEVAAPETLAVEEGHAFLRGRQVPLRDAHVNVMTHAFLFGTAVYEGIRGYAHPDTGQVYLFRLQDHFRRLLESCGVLRISLPYSVEDMCRLTTELVQVNGIREDCYVRPIAYKAGLQFGLRLADRDDLAIVAVPLERFHRDRTSLSVCVSSWRRVRDNAIPARAKINGAYVNSALAMTEALERGFDDAIFLTEDGYVSEGTGMNVFIVRGGRVCTPSVTDDILEGITRDTVIHLLERHMGIKVEARRINRTELYTAEEIFFCGTGMEVVSVGQVDGRTVGRGQSPLVDALRRRYFELVRGVAEECPAGWRTPVHGGFGNPAVQCDPPGGT